MGVTGKTAEAPSCRVSVIMPVFNSAEYVKHAITTVLAESEESMELIIVDDGSVDGSGEVCDRIASKDSRVRVIHRQNGGLCSARNLALDQVHGEYVTFCDNDDEVFPGFVTANYEYARACNADILRFGRKMVRTDVGGKVVRSTEVRPRAQWALRGGNAWASMPRIDYHSNGVWCGMYRTAFLKKHNLRFDESFTHGLEDTLFNDMAYEHAEVVAFTTRVCYLWNRREGHSVSTGIPDQKFSNLAKVLSYEYILMQRAGLCVTDADWCADRLAFVYGDFLTAASYSRERNYAQEASVYERLGDIVTPYASELRGCGSPVTKFVMSALVNHRFRSLYTFLGAGFVTRRLVSSGSSYLHGLLSRREVLDDCITA